MCCCEKPTINGQDGYSWDGKNISRYPVMPPDLEECDALIFDLPGRCGRLDCHSHHYRVVIRKGSTTLLVKHGAGQEKIDFLFNLVDSLKTLDSNSQFWICSAIFETSKRAQIEARNKERAYWQSAIVEKRIKTRRKNGRISVWVVDRQ